MYNHMLVILLLCVFYMFDILNDCNFASILFFIYMSAHVLLNLLKELRKRHKMQGLSSILSLFRNEFNNFNNTGAQMLDSVYHMASKLF